MVMSERRGLGGSLLLFWPGVSMRATVLSHSCGKGVEPADLNGFRVLIISNISFSVNVVIRMSLLFWIGVGWDRPIEESEAWRLN